MTGPKIVSTCVLVAITLGLALRRKRPLHIGIMATALAADTGLVLYLEVTRGAVEKAVSGMHALLAVHLAFSIATLVLYGVQLWLGIRIVRNDPAARGRHVRAALAFIACRLGSYATSFFV